MSNDVRLYDGAANPTDVVLRPVGGYVGSGGMEWGGAATVRFIPGRVVPRQQFTGGVSFARPNAWWTVPELYEVTGAGGFTISGRAAVRFTMANDDDEVIELLAQRRRQRKHRLVEV